MMQTTQYGVKGSNNGQPGLFDLPRQEAYPNLLKGGTARRNRKVKPLNGEPQTDAERRRDQCSKWHSSKITAALIRWALAHTRVDKRSVELDVVLFLILHVGWNPTKPDYLQCENLTYDRIAEGVGCTPRTVKSAITNLRKRGLIKRDYVNWRGRGQRRCNRYTLLGTGAVMEWSSKPLTPSELKSLGTRLSGTPKKPRDTIKRSLGTRLSGFWPALSSIIKKNLLINGEIATASAKTDRVKRVSSSQVTGAYRKRYRTPDHVPSFDQLTEQNKWYALECIEIFRGAFANKTDPRPIDYEGRERWMLDTLLCDPSRVWAGLQAARRECPGRPLFTGKINRTLMPLRQELLEPKEAPVPQAERQANIQRMEQLTAEAFSASRAPAHTSTNELAEWDRRVEVRATRKGITLEKARRELEAQQQQQAEYVRQREACGRKP